MVTKIPRGRPYRGGGGGGGGEVNIFANTFACSYLRVVLFLSFNYKKI